MDLLENNMFRRVLAGFAALLSSLALPAMADEPDGYYEQAYGKSGYALKTALHQIIRDHASLSYDALWDAFRTTDVREDGYVWDMYSDCDFRFGSNQQSMRQLQAGGRLLQPGAFFSQELVR